MLGRHGTDLERADREGLAHLDLENALEPPLAEQSAEAAWDDDRQLLAEPLERGQVEVVVVRVRDEDGVDAAERPRRHGDERLRCATRLRSSGSVSRRTPSRSTKTVACPTYSIRATRER